MDLGAWRTAAMAHAPLLPPYEHPPVGYVKQTGHKGRGRGAYFGLAPALLAIWRCEKAKGGG
jgi:hypothetical protein